VSELCEAGATREEASMRRTWAIIGVTDVDRSFVRKPVIVSGQPTKEGKSFSRGANSKSAPFHVATDDRRRGPFP
jgi:hypothetical protein